MQHVCVVGSGPRNLLANPSRKGERLQLQPQVVVGLERRALQSGAARRAPQEEAQLLMGKCGKRWEGSRESSRTPVFGILAYGPILVSKCDSGHGCRPRHLRLKSSSIFKLHTVYITSPLHRLLWNLTKPCYFWAPVGFSTFPGRPSLSLGWLDWRRPGFAWICSPWQLHSVPWNKN